jgi:hypothetical protein
LRGSFRSLASARLCWPSCWKAPAQWLDCLSYVIATDQSNADAIWVTEVWESKAAHTASLALPNVRAAIAQAMPHIAGFEPVAETTPVGRIGLGYGIHDKI